MEGAEQFLNLQGHCYENFSHLDLFFYIRIKRSRYESIVSGVDECFREKIYVIV